jgi:TolA-binding protein
MRFVLIILVFLSVSMSVTAKQLQPPLPTDHQLTFEEFEARELLMQYQINLWELLDQLRYATGELRVRVLEEIHEMQRLINQQLLKIVELDQKYHGK